MCNQWCLDFSARALPHLGAGTRMLEVGSLDVNGTVRAVLGHAVASYYGVDIRPGPGVDEVLDVAHLSARFGASAFDLVASTEMLEHCHDWQDALYQMLAVVKPGGLMLVTTRSPGFPLHDHPADHWRFEKQELARLLEPVGTVVELEDDFSLGWPCGVGVIVRKRKDGPALEAWLADANRHRVTAVDPVADAFTTNNSRFVPFHEYSVHRTCAQLMTTLAPLDARVVDVSAGTGSRVKLCAPRADVRHRPVTDDRWPNLAAEPAFDCAVAVDTLDLVPAARRDEFLGALAAAATKVVIVAGPFAEEGSLEATVARLQALGLQVAVHANGYLPWLVPLAELWRRCEGHRPLADRLAPVLADANHRFARLDHLEPAHRRVIVAARGVRPAAPPVASLESYREAARELGEWWATAGPLFDLALAGSGGPAKT